MYDTHESTNKRINNERFCYCKMTSCHSCGSAHTCTLCGSNPDKHTIEYRIHSCKDESCAQSDLCSTLRPWLFPSVDDYIHGGYDNAQQGGWNGQWTLYIPLLYAIRKMLLIPYRAR